MARNRQRAKERKDKLARDNVPGEWEHGSAEVDRVEAEIVRGADGKLADGGDGTPPPGDGDDPFGRGDGDDDGDDGGSGAAPVPGAKPERPPGPRVLNFLKACVAELQRVQWPDRRGVGQATAVVLGFVVLAGAFLGLADVIAQRIVDILI